MSDVVRITSREFRRMLETSRTKDARIAELERREALLTAFVEAVEECDWVNADPELVQVAEGLFGKLTLAGFPWTDGDV